MAIMYNLAEQEQKDVFICSAIVWDCRGQSPTKKSLTLRSAQRDAFIATAEKEQTRTNTNNYKHFLLFCLT